MDRRLLVPVALVGLVAVGAGAAALARGSDPPDVRARPTAVLQNTTLVERCLPQLTRASLSEFETPVDPLTPAGVQVAKPLLPHRAGDLVSFVAARRVSGEVIWERLDRLCRMPARTPGGAPGSAPLPRSALAASASRPVRDRQLCTEAEDSTAAPEGDTGDTSTQVVVPDVRDFELEAEAWRGDQGLTVLGARHESTLVLCDLGTWSSGLHSVERIAPGPSPHLVTYRNGDRSRSEPDRYWLAGVFPSYGVDQRVRARTVVVTPPHAPAYRCPVRVRNVTSRLLGFYACVVEFPAETGTLGEQTTQVEVLDRDGGVLWRGRWQVGIEGH